MDSISLQAVPIGLMCNHCALLAFVLDNIDEGAVDAQEEADGMPMIVTLYSLVNESAPYSLVRTNRMSSGYRCRILSIRTFEMLCEEMLTCTLLLQLF